MRGILCVPALPYQPLHRTVGRRIDGYRSSVIELHLSNISLRPMQNGICTVAGQHIAAGFRNIGKIDTKAKRISGYAIIGHQVIPDIW